MQRLSQSVRQCLAHEEGWNTLPALEHDDAGSGHARPLRQQLFRQASSFTRFPEYGSKALDELIWLRLGQSSGIFRWTV